MNFIPKIEYIELGTLLPKTITFGNPPEGDPFGEDLKVNAITTTSNNGRVQTQFNYIEQGYNLGFIFQTKLVMDAVEDFFINHASRGGKFNYFESSDEVEFKTFRLASKAIKKGRPIPDGNDDFEYDFSLKLSRVL